MELSKRAAGGALVAATAFGAGTAVVLAGADPGPTPAAVLTTLLALAVAALTVFATDRRQERQLAAERGRLQDQLSHERGLADRAELRRLMDEAAVALHHASNAQGKADAAISQHGRSIGENWPEAVEELGETGRAVDTLGQRLAIRLGPRDSVTRAFADARDSAQAVFSPVSYLANFGQDEGRDTLRSTHEEMQQARASYEEARGRFVDLAVPLVASKVDD